MHAILDAGDTVDTVRTQLFFMLATARSIAGNTT